MEEVGVILNRLLDCSYFLSTVDAWESFTTTVIKEVSIPLLVNKNF